MLAAGASIASFDIADQMIREFDENCKTYLNSK